MDTGTTLLVYLAVGALLGVASSVVTRREGWKTGVAFAVVVVVVGLAVIATRGESVLFPVIGAMLTFSVAASLFDPRPNGLFHSTR